MAFQLFSPPRLRLPDVNRSRHSTWLEAFYDLVFVVAITALGTRLDQATSLLGAFQFVGLFLAVWWAWLGHTVYNTRFDTDDLFQRLWTMGIMIAAAAMAVVIPRAFVGIPILRRAPVDTAHLPERLGLFTLIILGEIVSVLVLAVSGNNVQSTALIAAFVTFCIPACIWWAYFTFIDAAPFVSRLSSGQPYMYAHLPTYIGLTMVGVGLGHVINDASGATLHVNTRLLLGSGVSLWLLAALLLKLVSFQQRPANWVFVRHIGLILCVVTLLAFGDRLPPLLVISLLALFFVTFVIFEARHWAQWDRKDSEAQGEQS